MSRKKAMPWWAVAMLSLLATLGVALVGCGGETKSAPSTVTKTGGSTSNALSTTAIPEPAIPNYKVIGTTYKRRDNTPDYYVTIGPVDLSNDAFKGNVKLVLQAIAKTNGGPNFTSWVYDDEAIAKTAYSYDTNPLSGTLDEKKAFWNQQEQHLVADYVGGWDTIHAQPSSADDAYNIDWYPSASTDSRNVGKYVDREQWKP